MSSTVTSHSRNIDTFSTHLADRSCIPNCLWIINPMHFLDIFNVSTIFVIEIHWAWLTISVVYTPIPCCLLGFKISVQKVGILPLQCWVRWSFVTQCLNCTWLSFLVFFCRNNKLMMVLYSKIENSSLFFGWDSLVNDLKIFSKQKYPQISCKLVLYNIKSHSFYLWWQNSIHILRSISDWELFSTTIFHYSLSFWFSLNLNYLF